MDTKVAQVSKPAVSPTSKSAALFQHKIVASMMLPALARVNVRAAFTQNAVRQAAVACALERYRLAHGDWPQKLEDMTQLMTEIPRDVVDGKPLKYERLGNDQFTLYSVGWNEIDDGGEVVLNRDSSLDIEEGDWVWR